MNLLIFPLLTALALPTAVDAFPFRKDKCTNYKYSSAQLFKNKVNSVVVIKTSESTGSGFVVKHEKGSTFILTNAHVVNNKKRVDIKWSNKEKDSGEVVGNLGGYVLEKDLALVKIKGIKGNPVSFIKNPPEIGSDAVVIGAPSGLEFSLTRGVVSQIRENGDFVQIDAPVNPGNSGGPVFNHAGCVIGVVTFKAGENSEGLNFAIGSQLITKFVNNPFIDKEAINKQLLTKLPSPPIPPEGPFPPFNYADVYAAKNADIMHYPNVYKRYQKEIENDKKGNKRWSTLTIYTEISANKEPNIWRFMIEPKSLRKDGNWYKIRTLVNVPEMYMESISTDKDGFRTAHYPFGGLQKTYSVNCKEQKVEGAILPHKFVLTPSGWFLTSYENYWGQIKYDDFYNYEMLDFLETSPSMIKELDPEKWVKESEAKTNKREVIQMKAKALYRYFCE
tara:strand:- start:352 stop:1695 length:1344 start_codon:yes stop_codon:yes gene_type:complete